MSAPPVPCPECGFDPRGLSPADGAVALRTLPGRFRAAAAPPEDEDEDGNGVGRDDAARRNAAVAAAGQAAEAIAGLADDLRKVLIEDDPALTTTGDEVTAMRHGGDPATAFERLTTVTTDLAVLVSSQPAEAWTRSGTRATGQVSAADLLREAVHAGVHRLYALERPSRG